MSWGNKWMNENIKVDGDNLVFVCDICETVFDPGETGFQALIDKARANGWLIKFYIDREGYAMKCSKCNIVIP